jgi:hypothetical protein
MAKAASPHLRSTDDHPACTGPDWTRTEKQESALLQILSLDCLYSLPGRLQVGVAGHMLMPRLQTSIWVNPEQSYP